MSDQNTVTVPEFILMSPRSHNKLVRESLALECQNHINARLPGHFEHSAAQKYKYMKRQPRYIQYKIRRYRTGTDLVRSGASKIYILSNARFALLGSASEGTIGATIRSRFPFAGGTGRTLDAAARARMGLGPQTRAEATGVTPAVMNDEVARVIPQETRDIADGIRRNYVDGIKKQRRPRLVSGTIWPSN